MTGTVRMLGTRGVPANHGGFETAAENIGLELIRRGWRVIVYCQTPGAPSGGSVDMWRGIERVHLPDRLNGPLGTIWFDALAMRHATKHDDLCLMFGYNTAFLGERLRRRRVPTVINMDGVEWKRARWRAWQRWFLHVNERLACRLGDELIADHPVIERHLRNVAPRARVTTITYGAPAVSASEPALLEQFGVESGSYLTIVARPVPENSILEMVTAFSRRARGAKLLILGSYPEDDEYCNAVRQAASAEVIFAGPLYDSPSLRAVRLFALAHAHGHTVGGTNPSLVEALGSGNAVLAQDNEFNRWVAQDAAIYFDGVDDFASCLERLLDSPDLVSSLSAAARARHATEFEWSTITDKYEQLLISARARITHTAPPVSVPVTMPQERTRTDVGTSGSTGTTVKSRES